MATILVVDDEADLREEVVDWLVLEGHDVVSAGDGVSAVEAALAHNPDLIICDITMPHRSGYSVLLEVRAWQAAAPFIFVTARAAYEDIRKGMELGADDYITKPFSRQELLQAIQTRLAKKAALEQEHQRKLDQLQQALDHEHEQRVLKGRLVAMFSHDFHNPLSSILMTNSLLRDHAAGLTEAQRVAYMNRIETSTRLLMQMLEDLFTVAQMETGNLEYKPEPLDLDGFFGQIVEEFHTVYGDRRPVQLDNRVQGAALLDKRLLRQIVTNLISNALKYSPNEGVVQVTLQRCPAAFVFTVEDRGAGIPEAEQQHIFDPFRRGSNAGGVSGKGLGLAIVKQAVTLHSGAIHLDSRPGEGTTVTVTLPAALAGPP